MRKLNIAAQRVAQDARTRPLAHVAWRQGLSDQRWVRLDLPETSADAARHFEGRILLRAGKPLSVTLELRAQKARQPASGPESGPESGPVSGPVSGQLESRRIDQMNLTRGTHYGENQYFDHPALAAIVRIDAIVAGEVADQVTVESE